MTLKSGSLARARQAPGQAASGPHLLSLSSPFIKRPVATSLIAIAFLLLGLVAYLKLPVAALPQVDFPTLQVSANLPGASPETMASNVATPLERQFSLITGITQMTSVSSLGSTNITVQFALNRKIDSAAADVLAAINAASGQLPTNLPSAPSFRKVNPADAPVMILALTSDTLPLSEVSDEADSILAQQISRIEGVGLVSVAGAQKPAMRIQIDPRRVAALGLQIDAIRASIAANTVNAPKGSINGARQNLTVYANDQVLDPATWQNLVIGYHNGAAVRIKDIGSAEKGVENNQIGAWAFPGKANTDKTLNGGQSILLIVFKQPGANVIQAVDRVRKALPQLQNDIPPGIAIHILADRTQTIRASVRDVETTLLITMILVVLVIFLFLRNVRATLIPSAVIPLALLATAALMLPLKFSLDNLSLMALSIAVGFVVDDAIVMVESIWQRIEHGQAPFQAALDGAGDISFTILSISISLVAVFTPLMFMGGVVGRLMQEFAFVLSGAVVLSVFLSLTRHADAVRPVPASAKAAVQPLHQGAGDGFTRLEESYARGLDVVLRHRLLTLIVFLGTHGGGRLHVRDGRTPASFRSRTPASSAAWCVTSQDASFRQAERQDRGRSANVLRQDDAIAGFAFFVGGSGANQAKSASASSRRTKAATANIDAVIARLRPKLAGLVGVQTFLQATQDINVGGRAGRAQYQYTLSDADLTELNSWAPQAARPRCRSCRSSRTSARTSSRSAGALNLEIDRNAAARFGISPIRDRRGGLQT